MARRAAASRVTLATALGCLPSMAAAAPPRYDLLLAGGRVVDPGNGLDARRDVAIAEGKIALVAPAIPAASAHKTIDVRGLLVTPGLVDIHAHFLAPEPSAIGPPPLPDSHTLRTCVTTAVDAGGVGWRDFARLRQAVVAPSKTRVLAFLNIVGHGMRDRANQQDVADMEPARVAEMARAHPDVVVGIKTAHFDGPEWTAVDRTIEAGRLAGLPVMIDFGTFRPERPFQTLVLEKMRPGDIYTHLFLHAVPMLDERGRLLPYLRQAQQRGVIFDVGHGQGSFLFRQAVPAIRQGLLPDVISSDLHGGSMNGGMKDLPNVMSKLASIGMPVPEVIARATSAAARAIRRPELGHLGVGAPADVAVLRVERGRFAYVDSFKARMDGRLRLGCEMTIRAGLVHYEREGWSRPRWDRLGRCASQGDPRWDGTGEDRPRPQASSDARR